MKQVNVMKKCSVLMMVLMMFLFTLTPSTKAQEVSENKEMDVSINYLKEAYNISKEEAVDLFSEVEKAQVFYKFDRNGDLYFDAKGALVNNVSPTLVKEITDAFKTLESNDVTLNKDYGAAETCHGVQRVDEGLKKVRANSCKTSQLSMNLTLLGAGAAIVGITAGILGMPIVGAIYAIVAILIEVGAVYVNYKNRGCGIIISWGGDGISTQTGCSNYR